MRSPFPVDTVSGVVAAAAVDAAEEAVADGGVVVAGGSVLLQAHAKRAATIDIEPRFMPRS